MNASTEVKAGEVCTVFQTINLHVPFTSLFYLLRPMALLRIVLVHRRESMDFTVSSIIRGLLLLTPLLLACLVASSLPEADQSSGPVVASPGTENAEMANDIGERHVFTRLDRPTRQRLGVSVGSRKVLRRMEYTNLLRYAARRREGAVRSPLQISVHSFVHSTQYAVPRHVARRMG
jgi:hypothetical protein